MIKTNFQKKKQFNAFIKPFKKFAKNKKANDIPGILAQIKKKLDEINDIETEIKKIDVECMEAIVNLKKANM